MSMLHERSGDLFGEHGIRMVAEARFLDITALVEQFWHEPKDYFSYSEDLTGLLLPWPLAWLEFRLPRTLRLGGQRMSTGPRAAMRFGAMVAWQRVVDGAQALQTDALLLNAWLLLPEPQRTVAPYLTPPAVAARRRRLADHLAAGRLPNWILMAAVYIEDNLRERKQAAHRAEDIACVNHSLYFLDEAGNALWDLTVSHYPQGPGSEDSFAPFAYAISHLHRDSVRLREIATRSGAPSAHRRPALARPPKREKRFLQ